MLFPLFLLFGSNSDVFLQTVWFRWRLSIFPLSYGEYLQFQLCIFLLSYGNIFWLFPSDAQWMSWLSFLLLSGLHFDFFQSTQNAFQPVYIKFSLTLICYFYNSCLVITLLFSLLYHACVLSFLFDYSFVSIVDDNFSQCCFDYYRYVLWYSIFM